MTTDPLAPCPGCGAEWSEVLDREPVPGDHGEPEGGLEMQHAADCPRLAELAALTETIVEASLYLP